MGWFKKLLLAMVFIVGGVTLGREFKEFGLQIGMVLTAAFFLSCAFLWHWASGYLPQIGKFKAILIMMVFSLLLMATVDYAMADFTFVDMIDVLQSTIRRSPWFYLATFFGAGVKVLFWNWLFAGVRESHAAKAVQA
ncbi:MAG: hypothetical protein WAK61_20315 [Leclercia sp.]